MRSVLDAVGVDDAHGREFDLLAGSGLPLVTGAARRCRRRQIRIRRPEPVTDDEPWILVERRSASARVFFDVDGVLIDSLGDHRRFDADEVAQVRGCRSSSPTSSTSPARISSLLDSACQPRWPSSSPPLASRLEYVAASGRGRRGDVSRSAITRPRMRASTRDAGAIACSPACDALPRDLEYAGDIVAALGDARRFPSTARTSSFDSFAPLSPRRRGVWAKARGGWRRAGRTHLRRRSARRRRRWGRRPAAGSSALATAGGSLSANEEVPVARSVAALQYSCRLATLPCDSGRPIRRTKKVCRCRPKLASRHVTPELHPSSRVRLEVVEVSRGSAC